MDNFDRKRFLQECWQKKPCVLRGAFSDPYWLEPDDLAGLACEEGVEARIIKEQSGKWSVESGPFPEDRFSSLPETQWTLLVQAVDQWVPDVRQILNHFSFLPSWRLDDIMVSYAPVGGTVSQHYDFFDVFLIQGEGTRKWQVGEVCGSHSELLSDTSVRILKQFEAVHEFVLEPGDVLYIPAKHSHYGVSVADSMTYSVGFRAPGVREIVDGIATEAMSSLLEDDRYIDTQESLMANTGEIPDAAVEKVQRMLVSALSDQEVIRRWLGGYVTERKYSDFELCVLNAGDWREKIAAGEFVLKNPSSRFAYSRQILFVDGIEYATSQELARCVADSYPDEALDLKRFLNDESDSDALCSLVEAGCLIFSDEQE
ncbi:MAG: cupin domain-containing protein [Pseudomonadota bacterium]|nr:cupin domain-containing protein [Pseudomonadota bacterium]